MPATTSPSLTVIMPAYNEEAAIADAVEDVRRCVFPHVRDCRLVVVNDGSKDRTGSIADELSLSDPRVYVSHKLNGGHGSALRTGLDGATSDYVMLIDSDRQMPLDGFASEWKLAQEHDGFFAIRMNRDDPRIRLILTAIIRLSLRIVFGVSIRDANVPYKIFRRSIWLDARPLIPAESIAPSLFLAIFVRYRKLNVLEQQIKHCRRRTGVVSVRQWKLIKFCGKGFLQLIRFRIELLG